MKCPHCHQTDKQSKIGKTAAGSQRYLCTFCKRKYTPQPKRKGYPESLQQQALKMYVDGLNLRRIGRHLGVHHTTVLLWVKAHATGLPQPPQPEEVDTAELDELYSFIGNKKTESTS